MSTLYKPLVLLFSLLFSFPLLLAPTSRFIDFVRNSRTLVVSRGDDVVQQAVFGSSKMELGSMFGRYFRGEMSYFVQNIDGNSSDPRRRMHPELIDTNRYLGLSLTCTDFAAYIRWVELGTLGRKCYCVCSGCPPFVGNHILPSLWRAKATPKFASFGFQYLWNLDRTEAQRGRKRNFMSGSSGHMRQHFWIGQNVNNITIREASQHDLLPGEWDTGELCIDRDQDLLIALDGNSVVIKWICSPFRNLSISLPQQVLPRDPILDPQYIG
ncbi:hypothetical protein BDN72DRAFT_882322 [Pluteus cervinus]|uniref:Uncharacterized protein n=1 Tax=Pluteus cervinus TaxID=181527 RepID=A0ACD3ABC0_9AGAR|nr:hypothetical protein BDN72DRAFT_882322 [Pluteus cervinus]